MLCGRRRELQAGDCRRLPPAELLHLVRSHAPIDEPIANTQGREEMLHLGRKRENALAVEVVVMVMGEDDPLDLRQVCKRDGQRVETLWADPLHRRSPLGKDRVREPEATSQLERHRRVAQPEERSVRRRQ
ncbi:hypothetical protein D3C72_1716840 [compost metagenome]